MLRLLQALLLVSLFALIYMVMTGTLLDEQARTQINFGMVIGVLLLILHNLHVRK
ncbi:hypothetical protein ACFFK0_04945 [Paenibacillus chartarius]|uniref:Uncharacterized protein n=1 Tax=Paenibacillus chartarius TaxID=747481 RepID=A0ABV6DGQ8_9BACL